MESVGTIEGSFEVDAASGVIEFGDGIRIADTWTAAMTAGPPRHLSASFRGATTCQGTSCDYEGSFILSRVE